SIMGKVKLRVSSILPSSLGKWFSPSTTEGSAGRVDQSPTSLQQQQLQQQQQQQQNGGSVLPAKRKRSRRRIELDTDDAPDVIDDAQDLNEEEVQLADNIAEHDLAAEDEQTRRGEYNVNNMLRSTNKSAAKVWAPAYYDEDDDEELDEEEDEEPQDQDEIRNFQQQQLQLSNRSGLGFTIPQFSAQRRRPPLHASTPAVSDPLQRSHAPPNRSQLNLNSAGQQQRQREPPYNFLAAAAGPSNEAAIATSGDLPMSSRRSLNIPPMTERRETLLPSYKRLSLLGQQRGHNWRTCSPISEVDSQQQQQSQQPSQPLQTTLTRQESNTNVSVNVNNNNNIINAKRATAGAADSHSECESTESQAGLRTHNINNNNNNDISSNINNNNNLLFYGNLQSRKSVFNSNAGTPPHHNSTLSLNSLNNRRRFNASIYGSTSALSDSRLLSSSCSANMVGSPFYKGPTAFGGSAANNRYFSQGNLAIINSGGSSPAPSNSDSISSSARCISSLNYTMKPVEMRPNNSSASNNSAAPGSATDVASGLSQTAQRILYLLENHTTPLMDAKKMGSTLREHQLQRISNSRQGAKPYSYPYKLHNNNNNNTNVNNYNNNCATAEQDATRTNSKLLVPTMLQLLERRRLQRLPTASVRQQQQHHHQPQSQSSQQTIRLLPTTNSSSSSSSTSTVGNAASTAAANTAGAAKGHTNKMRTRLLQQSRKDTRSQDEELPPPAIDLPEIRFPSMASEPKFDLTFAPPPKAVASATPVASGVAAAVASKAATAANNDDKRMKREYKFQSPLLLQCDDSDKDGDAIPTKRAKSNFRFTPPTPIDVHLEQQPTPKQPQQLNGDRSLKTSGSVLDVLLVQKPAAAATATAAATVMTSSAFEGFGGQFKKPAGEWECEACMVRNKQEESKCIACETAKPKAKPAAPAPPSAASVSMPAMSAGFSGFADRFKQPAGNWECDACMVSNKADASKCVACETPRKTAAPTAAASSAANTAAAAAGGSSKMLPATSGFGDAFKPKANTWSCDTCMVSNPSSAAKCVACETPNAKAGATKLISTSTVFKASVGFGDAFKPKANTWSCDTCMVSNPSSALKCVACESPNPEANARSSSTNSLTSCNSLTSGSSNNFSFGFASKPEPAKPAAAVAAPKPDVGFQQLIAAQKSSSWTCEVCTAQNDVGRSKCICCEQQKPGSSVEALNSSNGAASAVPKFMFGFATKPETKPTPPVATAAVAAPAPVAVAVAAAPTVAAPTVAAGTPFSFGFAAAGKDVADKPATTTTTTATATKSALTTTTTLNTSAAAAAPALTGFKFGVDTMPGKTVSFKLSEPQTTSGTPQGVAAAATTNSAAAATTTVGTTVAAATTKPAEAADLTAPVSSKAPATSSIGLGLFAPAATAAPALALSVPPTATKPATFAFGATPVAAPAAAPAAAIATSTTTAPAAGNKPFTFGAFAASAAAVSSSSNNSASSLKPGATIFSFGQQQKSPTTTTIPTAAAPAPATLFGQPAPTVAAAAPTSTPAPFLFGSQSALAAASTTTTAAATTTTSGAASGSFFFGAPATAAARTHTATSSISSNNIFNSSNTTTTSVATTSVFNFGSSSNNNTTTTTPFAAGSTFGGFGVKPAAAAAAAATLATAATSATSSFSWSAPSTVAVNQFASGGFGSSAATTTTNTTAAGSPFSLASGPVGSGSLSAVFANVSNPFGATASPAVASPLSNIFSNSGSNNQLKQNSSTVTVTATTHDKPAFNFGAAATAAT
ncbi:hypothetical protein KR093_009484, partial [Drosophila rubida]